MTVFFTSDLHLGHKNVIEFCRPEFKNIDHHNEAIVERWNDTVHKRDKVFVLGDVAWGKESLALLGEMAGTKELIIGNHDQQRTEEYLKYFTKVHGLRRYKEFVLSHCPVHPTEMMYRWKYNLHGHIHMKEKDIKDPRYFNVGVDFHAYGPVSLEEVRRKIVLSALGYI